MHLIFECQHANIAGAREDYMVGLHECLGCVDEDHGESWVEVRRLAFAFERYFSNRVPWPEGATFEGLHPAGGESEKGYRRVLGWAACSIIPSSLAGGLRRSALQRHGVRPGWAPISSQPESVCAILSGRRTRRHAHGICVESGRVSGSGRRGGVGRRGW